MIALSDEATYPAWSNIPFRRRDLTCDCESQIDGEGGLGVDRFS